MALERAHSVPAVDEAVFTRLAADLGAQHIPEVCRLFLENAASGIDALRQALDAGDAPAVTDAAHRLRSASGFLGATRLAVLCAAIEAGAPTGDPGETLVAELRHTEAELDQLVGRMARAGEPAR